jgi:hypothetical protein
LTGLRQDAQIKPGGIAQPGSVGGAKVMIVASGSQQLALQFPHHRIQRRPLMPVLQHHRDKPAVEALVPLRMLNPDT